MARAYYPYNNHHLYILAFRHANMFKIGVTSGDSFARIRCHVRNFSIDPKKSKMVCAGEETVIDLEARILEKFSPYNVSQEAKAKFGNFDGYTEVLSLDCLDEVIDYIETYENVFYTGIVITYGLSLPGIYTDNNIDQTPTNTRKKLPYQLKHTTLIKQVNALLDSPRVSRINSGYTKKVSYFALHYLIEAEEGFLDSFFDEHYEVQNEFFHEGLQIKHLFYSGQKLRSGASYIRGKLYLKQFPEGLFAGSSKAEIKAFNNLFNTLSHHPKRDLNFKIKCSSLGRFVAYFQSYVYGQKVMIGKTLNYPDSCLVYPPTKPYSESLKNMVDR